MTDPRKIRIRYEIDVTLDQSEYGPEGQSAQEVLGAILPRITTSLGRRQLISEWNLDLDAHFSAEIVDK